MVWGKARGKRKVFKKKGWGDEIDPRKDPRRREKLPRVRIGKHSPRKKKEGDWLTKQANGGTKAKVPTFSTECERTVP